MHRRLYLLFILPIFCLIQTNSEVGADFASQVIAPAVNFLAKETTRAFKSNDNNYMNGYNGSNGQGNVIYYYNNNANGTGNPYFTPQQGQTVYINSNQSNPNFALINQGIIGDNSLKSVAISSDGRRIARVTKLDNQECVTIRIQPNFEKKILNVINPESIEGIYFAGSRYLVCTIKNLNNNLWHLRVVDLQQNLNQRSIVYRNLSPISNAMYIGVITPRSANSELICTTSFNGTSYVTQKINLRTGAILYRIEGNQAPVVDKSLNVRIFYNLSTNVLGTNASYNAYLASSNTNNNTINSNKLIESIADIDRTRYVAVVGNMCYKIEMLGDNSLTLRGINLNGNVISDFGTINGVSNLLDCAVNLDSVGNPSFITVGSGDVAQNYPITTESQADLAALNTEFSGVGWSRVGYTGDGKVWVLCVYTQPASRFFIYDTRNGGISEITDKGLQATKFLNKQQAIVNQQQAIINNGMVVGSGMQMVNQPQMMRII